MDVEDVEVVTMGVVCRDTFGGEDSGAGEGGGTVRVQKLKTLCSLS